MANRGYDVVVDVDAEGDLGHTDLQEDLEFHSSNFENTPSANRGKLPAGNNSFLPTSSAPSSGSKHFLWSLSFYAQFFDVDTNEVLRRCRAVAFPYSNFLDVLDGNPDLYGPFWIATTVVVILFLTGTISQYLAREGKTHFAYDFTLLSGAAGLIYGYTFVIPAALWGALKWFKAESANLLECVTLYGYANLVWIAVALISWSPYSIMNWVFCAVGLAYSTFFLVRNLYPVLNATDMKTSRILLVVVIALHVGFALAIKILFFAHGSPAAKNKAPASDDSGEAASRLLFAF